MIILDNNNNNNNASLFNSTLSSLQIEIFY